MVGRVSELTELIDSTNDDLIEIIDLAETANTDARNKKQTKSNFLRQPVVTKTSAYTLTNLDYLIIGDATSAAFTLLLPTAVGISGKIFVIKKTGNSANVLTIDGNASETIDDALTYLMVVQNDTVVIQSDGTNWKIIQHYNKAPYAQLSHSANQMNPASSAAVDIIFNTNDSLVGLTHSISVNTHQIIIVEPGIYQFIAGGQVGRSSGTGVDTHNMWMLKGGTKIVNTNVKTYLPATAAQTSVVFLNWIGFLAAGDVISFAQSSQSLTTGVTGLIATAAGTPPVTPSIILTILKLSD